MEKSVNVVVNHVRNTHTNIRRKGTAFEQLTDDSGYTKGKKRENS